MVGLKNTKAYTYLASGVLFLVSSEISRPLSGNFCWFLDSVLCPFSDHNLFLLFLLFLSKVGP